VERTVLAGLTVVGATAAGVGWLYLLFQAGALAAGPRFAGALPLQQLAGNDAQPLARLAVAWLPAGLGAGAALAGLTGLGRAARAVVVAAIGSILLVAAGAVSDAVALNERVVPQLGHQLSRAGTWIAVGLLVIGSLPAGRWRREPRARGRASIRR
jgi:hypothetical protein